MKLVRSWGRSASAIIQKFLNHLLMTMNLVALATNFVASPTSSTSVPLLGVTLQMATKWRSMFFGRACYQFTVLLVVSRSGIRISGVALGSQDEQVLESGTLVDFNAFVVCLRLGAAVKRFGNSFKSARTMLPGVSVNKSSAWLRVTTLLYILSVVDATSAQSATAASKEWPLRKLAPVTGIIGILVYLIYSWLRLNWLRIRFVPADQAPQYLPPVNPGPVRRMTFDQIIETSLPNPNTRAMEMNILPAIPTWLM